MLTTMRGPKVNILELSAALWLVAFVAGLLGSLTGLGGGVVIVPLLTLYFDVDIRYAIGASLVSVIATSSGAAIAYVRQGYSNIRIGMLLEIATTLGASGGALVAARVPANAIAVIFGSVLLATVYSSARVRAAEDIPKRSDPMAVRLRLEGSYPTEGGPKHYYVRRVPLGLFLMTLAGLLSGLLGIGSGAMKVLAMDKAMGLPFKVSTTTSNFMIGVTAAAGAGIYFASGYIDPGLAMPTMLGVLAGSLVGARILAATRPRMLRLVFAGVVLLLGVEMLYSGVTGRLR
jgi:uncharacterized membrane protein YfcA